MSDLLGFDFSLHPYWYLGRAGGFVAFGIMLASMVLGIAVSSRIFDGLLARAWFFEIHKFLSIFLVLAVLFHALIMLPDPYAKFTIDELLIPFRSHTKALPMAVGIITLYGLAIVTASFYFTKWIGQKTWRTLHYVTFACYMGGLLHSVWAGTDTTLVEVRFVYLGTGLTLVFFLLYRILAVRNSKKLGTVQSKPPISIAA